MKCTLGVLKTHLDTTASVEDIVKALTQQGLAVQVEDFAKTLDGFIVGHVVDCVQHPNADRLRCLQVDTGTETLNVVCGAPNARLGLKGVFAPVGCYVQGADFKIKKAKIRGEESCGMMCSERELLLSEAHEGIIELADDAVTGAPAAQALGVTDVVLTVTAPVPESDAPDADTGAVHDDSLQGLARILAAAGLGTLKAAA